MSLRNARFDKNSFKEQSPDFRISAIISDGMWLSQPKWRKLALVTEDELQEWIERKLANNEILQAKTGAKSYRMSHEQIVDWYEKNGFEIGEQILSHIFPVRIWDGMTETEGFLSAPLRELSMVTFHSDRKDVVDKIRTKLSGVGRMRETSPGVYKVYALSASYVKERIEPILREAYGKQTKLYSKNKSHRRELKDFPPHFSYQLIEFYQNFARSLVRGASETISIFIDEKEDQHSQLTMWVISAIEKFDEQLAVPFSGYLDTVLNRWVYDLPDEALGKELSHFQRQKSKAIRKLEKARIGGEHNREFSNAEIAEIMNIDKGKYFELESRNKLWSRLKSSASLTWDETSEEKRAEKIIKTETIQREDNDILLASQMSSAVVTAALNTGDYESAFSLITQIDSDDMDTTRLNNLSADFIKEFGSQMGLVGA